MLVFYGIRTGGSLMVEYDQVSPVVDGDAARRCQAFFGGAECYHQDHQGLV